MKDRSRKLLASLTPEQKLAMKRIGTRRDALIAGQIPLEQWTPGEIEAAKMFKAAANKLNSKNPVIRLKDIDPDTEIVES